MSVGLYVLRRLGGALGTLLAISFGVFALLRLAPGSVEQSILGTAVSSPEAVAAVRAEYRLDDPFLVQFWTWLQHAGRLDFGSSIRTGDPVWSTLVDHSAITLQLILMATVITTVVGVGLGVLAAVRAQSTVDRVAVALATIGQSAPAFATGILLLWVFGVTLGWFPIFGVGEGFADRLYHLTLPAVALALTTVAMVVKVTRTAMLDALAQDHYGFARSRGIGRMRTLRRYALRNASIPVLTATGLVVAAMLSTVVRVEVTFALPGIGSDLVSAISFKDVPVVQAVSLVMAATVVLSSLVVDLFYALADPRVRVGATA